MMIVRPTAKLMAHLKITGDNDLSPSTTILGDWYCNVLSFKAQRVILCTSEATLLPVLLSAKNIELFSKKFPEAVAEVLMTLGEAPLAVQAEIGEMRNFSIAKTVNRQVLGSMVDFARMLEFEVEEHPHILKASPVSLLELQLRLAKAPCSPIGMNSPDQATREIFRLKGSAGGAIRWE